MLKIISWNVNGLRACLSKGFNEYLQNSDADIILAQETKISEPCPDLDFHGYAAEFFYPKRKGYSGVLALYRKKPAEVIRGIGVPKFDYEGRILTLVYPDFYVVNAYIPNSQGGLARKYFRMEWDEAFRDYVCGLKENRPIIIGGDFNVAHEYIDVYPENLNNEENPPGFREEERGGLDSLLNCGFTDTFRYFYPKKDGAYTWWSNRGKKRIENRGWRIDYFLVSDDLLPLLKSAAIRSEIQGSDHCPIELDVCLS